MIGSDGITEQSRIRPALQPIPRFLMFVRPAFGEVADRVDFVIHDCAIAYARPHDCIAALLQGANENIEVFALNDNHRIALSVGKGELCYVSLRVTRSSSTKNPITPSRRTDNDIALTVSDSFKLFFLLVAFRTFFSGIRCNDVPAARTNVVLHPCDVPTLEHGIPEKFRIPFIGVERVPE